ncbi:hypothetical protein [Pseudemcibacter aquimaris]|uniref:hypothetical protein n=1 Tax=Pseudemcibacter aquimaris TaxID=2857064 RepID=UPI002010D16E|nr:hypothetical protein [Pseudemcibacter aquimaris]MCC3861391.1 hypothetical protein [Pseudemcibacter aquimaris]WDU58161.1 hypothetical protein KW060_13285 [Pseudemcibacter aquimaris]
MRLLSVLLMMVMTVPTIAHESADWREYLQETESHFKATKKRKQKLMEYLPRFKNISGRKIVDIRFTTEFLNDWGRPVYKMNGKIVQDLKPGRRTSKKEFYAFPDDPYIFDDAYDKLEPRTREEGASQKVVVTSIRFANGEVINF